MRKGSICNIGSKSLHAFYKEPLLQGAYNIGGRNIERRSTTSGKNLKNFEIWENIAVNNQEIGSRLHLFTGKIYADKFIKFLSYNICAFSLEFKPKLKVKFRILKFSFVCTAIMILCALKIRELLWNF